MLYSYYLENDDHEYPLDNEGLLRLAQSRLCYYESALLHRFQSVFYQQNAEDRPAYRKRQ